MTTEITLANSSYLQDDFWFGCQQTIAGPMCRSGRQEPRQCETVEAGVVGAIELIGAGVVGADVVRACIV